MAKKKQSKLNQKIRHYFDGDGFDDGIERVNTATLIALTQTLGVLADSLEKPQLVKLFRRLWSEGDMEIRTHILSFFKAENRIYPATHPKAPSPERDDVIHELIKELGVEGEEAKYLHHAFIGMRSKKITLSKMESSLKHFRFEGKKQALEKSLEGIFDLDDRFEFNASFEYSLFESAFKKIHTLKTPPFSYDYLFENDNEAIISTITELKTQEIARKQKRIDDFIAQITQEQHPHLSAKQIVTALKQLPPFSQSSYPELSNPLLNEVLKKSLALEMLTQSDHDIFLYLSQKASLPFSDKTLSYTLTLSLEKESFLKRLWEGEALHINTQLEEETQATHTHFYEELDDLILTCKQHSRLLHFSDEEIYNSVYEELLPLIHQNLSISPKIKRKVIYGFTKKIQVFLLKRQRQELLARTIRDFKNLFPLAREMRRQLILHIGPTNSGKTYTAMQQLKHSDTGYYLAPLRLLALEGYEDLRKEGLNASLITGEEQILDDEASHISSTIEMLSFEIDVDVCVIDEVQMIDDRDRGWAWANAIIGAPAKKLIMTGSPNAKDAIIALAEYLGEELEIIEFERKNPLHLMKHATPIAEIQAKTAVIAFSRRNVLRLKQQLSRLYKVSVIYGNLSPEVRREEARRFREGETEILVATDAIAMGLNLPIQTILFSKADKFDGENQRELTPSEIQQISGRAGRYGMSEAGYVGALKPDVLKIIHKHYNKPAHHINIPFHVMANLEHIKLVGGILEENSLTEILQFFVKNMKFDGPFRATNLEGMLEATEIIDRYELDLKTKFHLATAPLTTSSPYIMENFERYIRLLEKKEIVNFIPPQHLDDFAQSMEELLEAEDRVKEISLYLWLSYRFADYFLDIEKARQTRTELNRFIENSLKESHFVPRCRECSKPLPLNSTYAICQSCFRRLHRTPRRPYRTRQG
ncbi:MAG: SUV3 C-terminal domain-containing protein [Campylobacterota bacterium]|nr:SUV3 C-terminal domain-containing protein [Campylobacterota bacterium]